MPTTSKTSCTTSALIDAKDWLGIASRVAADPGVLDEVLVTLEIQRERAQKAEKEIDWLKGQVAHLEHKLERKHPVIPS